MSSTPLRRVRSRALRAASRAAAASMIFWTIVRAWAGFSSSHSLSLSAIRPFERLTHFRADQLVLGLRAELGVGQLHGHDRRQALAHVVARQSDLFLLQRARALGIIVERSGQCCAESREMRAAVALRDVVGEAKDVLVIGVIPLQRDVDPDILALPGDRDRIGHQRRLCAVEPLHEGRDTALVEHLDALGLLVARIGEERGELRN